MNKIWKILIGILIGLCIVTSVIVPLTIHFFSKTDNGEGDSIKILCDEDFEKYHFQGNGTIINPYLIENYILNTTEDNAIHIEDTSKYFIIHNCSVEAERVGIFIKNIALGTAKITRNICSNTLIYGIILVNAPGTLLTDNTCNSTSESGITLNYSSNVSLINNICNNGRSGISLNYSFYSVIINNTCNNNYHGGIYLYYSQYANLSYNTCNDNYDGAIGLDTSSSNATLIGNICNYNDIGIYLFYSNYPALYNNTCKNNWYNIHLYSCNHTTLTNNYCYNKYGDDDGINLIRSSYSTLINNSCINNQGISLELSSYITLINNSCNYSRSIHLYSSSHIILINNTCYDNLYGLELDRSSYCLIHYNSFLENIEYGITIDKYSDFNIIHHNSFIDNNQGGSSQAEDDGTNNIWYNDALSEGNYWSDWIGVGVYEIDGTVNSHDPYPLVNPPV
ncbi:MAG: hypothetical protein FK731_15675 [Asgard group archaeon]|nr:hypothetical protein [Asgard group archaeon]